MNGNCVKRKQKVDDMESAPVTLKELLGRICLLWWYTLGYYKRWNLTVLVCFGVRIKKVM